MYSIYEQGYIDALEKIGVDITKVAVRNPVKAAKGLLGKAFRKKPVALPTPTQFPSQQQISAGAQSYQAARQHPSEFAPWAPKKPAPPQPSNIAQFEAKMRGVQPPAIPASATSALKTFKRPQVVPTGQVPTAPPPKAAPAATPIAAPKPAPAATPTPKVKPELSPAEASAQVFMNESPKTPPKPGLLRRGARWALPAAGLAGGAYALSQSGKSMDPTIPQQYYGDMAPQYMGY